MSSRRSRPRSTSRALLVIWTALGTLVAGGPAAHAGRDGAAAPASSLVEGQGSDLTTQLDDLLSLAPDDTCFSLAIGGSTVYRHQGDRDLMPASTQKLVTAGAALEALGAEHAYSTRAMTGGAPVDGVVAGDLHLVGGGDPLLVTDAFRVITAMGDDQVPTRFEDIAEQVVASGVTRIDGRVIGDEGRYDSARTVATWPERYVGQRQAGPLSALTVDDGYRIVVPEPGSDRAPVWHRSTDPALDAARLLHDHLRVRGVEIAGEPIAGPSTGADHEVASVESAPLAEVVGQLLVESDNQTGELILKEIGRTETSAGSTETGIATVLETLDVMGLTPGDVTITDGSGLDRGNRISCDDLTTLLDASGGPEGVIGRALPVAGTNGTLQRRFSDTPLAGRLRAKTGRLSDVTALAGFTPMAGDEMATFAYISNGEPVTADLLALQEHLLTVVSLLDPPCPGGAPIPVSVPVGPLAGQVALLGTATGPFMAATATLLPLPAIAEHPDMAVANCGGQRRAAQFSASDATDGGS